MFVCYHATLAITIYKRLTFNTQQVDVTAETRLGPHSDSRTELSTVLYLHVQ